MRYIENFLNHIKVEKNFSSNTINSYRTDLTQYHNFIGKPVTDSKPSDILAFISHIKETGCSTSTANRKLSALKSFFHFLVREGIIGPNPAASIESGRTEQRLPKPLPKTQIEQLLASIDHPRDRLILELLYDSGIRRFELAQLKVADVNLEEGFICIRGKGRKERIVPLPEGMIHLLRNWVETLNSPWLFPSSKGKCITPRQVNNIVNKWAKLAGVDVTPHQLRHSFCSHLFDNGAELKVIQDLAGHHSASTTQLYTKVSLNRNRAEYLKYHPRANIKNM